jgi:hypothetical protein
MFAQTDNIVLASAASFLSIVRLDRLNALILVLVFSLVVLYFIRRAIRGDTLYVRPLAGLQAIDEAVGRATEMGKPVLFIPGTGDIDEIQTIAGLAILGLVSRVTARYETPLLVPVLYPMPMAAAQEVVREAYIDEGKADRVRPEMVQYIAGESFSYSARVGGMMLREKPAANIFMGSFRAESLLIAENRQNNRANKIYRTPEPEQLPFFIAACDYTLIGEELYAASAYLSREPKMLGSLKGQDLVKVILVIALVLGVVAVSLGFYPEVVRNLFTAN